MIIINSFDPPQFYFLPPIEAFELLPLESVSPSLNLSVLALTVVLLSLSVGSAVRPPVSNS